ncbi:Gfo/Idh/MocA family oxidoreductase [Serratia marcescens]|uniref:Gfo/Idh/MocA family oxidoreductase n=1 Tax=Serratia marcescens TaxID=615 RepID=UPI0009495010|nr:Gfo/Idh/MocA family oxidoreductase [Serratia marcescens]AVE48899.1 gfo/Idh/MocA family oxidoreductase [Serratia marcescens]MBH2592233.1 Gfo/Idh/MocA family oxidoreductase [Serratia marcescens]MBH2972225.1 Gfo/Idh/MocA family oxidoreductase [Serratia marcescens]MBH2978107.1 Gfo/Idh/MocA family oxidoreductase [Serratia marcescens]MBN3986880.1 Gfo/Idh/MocA family oxidoreductase [Serratia marcescens]
MTSKILIVGYGFAGKRMHTVLNYSNQNHKNAFRQIVIADPKMTGQVDGVLATYHDVEQALKHHRFEAAIVTVNEEHHHGILKRLTEADIPRILCEKPLTATLDEAKELEPALSAKIFSMNLVERFSPVFKDFFAWRNTVETLKPARVQLYWGKNRIRDCRPTMGVLSEAIHPLDLASFAFGIREIDVIGGFMHHSNFSNRPEDAIADSLHCKLISEDRCIISAHASFTWMSRRREMFAHLVGAKDSYIVHFTFDMPRWDCDSVTVSRIDPKDGHRTTVLQKSYTNQDFPEPLDQLSKVYRFVTRSIDDKPARMNEPDSIVGLEQAMRLQTWLEQIYLALEPQSKGQAEKLFAS